jgi:hypothetical protein
MMRDPENKLDEELSSLTFGRNIREFSISMADRAVHVHKEWAVANSALGFHVVPRQFWCNSSQKMIFIDFLSAGEDIEDQRFRHWGKGYLFEMILSL